MDKTEEKIRVLEDELNVGFIRGEISQFPIVKEPMSYLKENLGHFDKQNQLEFFRQQKDRPFDNHQT